MREVAMGTRLSSEIQDSENSPEDSGDTHGSAVSNEFNIASISAGRRRRRAIQRTVVSVPIKETIGLKQKGHQMSTPPSDSWTWRKYGQKPIKGSPYPRAYYRCSSSKGCPARKQVERCRMDPNMVVVAYSREHNHPTPASKNNHQPTNNHRKTTTSVAVANGTASTSEDREEEENKHVNRPTESREIVSEDKFSNLNEGPLIIGDEFGWLTDFESRSSCAIILDSPVLTEEIRIATDNKIEMFLDDDSLFADLGELPECSTVFRRGLVCNERRSNG